MAQKTALDKLNVAISKIVNEYADDVNADVVEIANRIGQTGVNALRANSRAAIRGKKYASGWRKQMETTRTGVTVTLYNIMPSLPHLLEHGHATRNGTGRTYAPTPAHPHIAPVEQMLVETFEREVIQRL